MDANQRAKSALAEIRNMEFNSYNDFLKKAIESGKLIKIKNALGELNMYYVVCEKCGETPDREYAETLST